MVKEQTKALLEKYAELKDDIKKIKDLDHLDDERKDELFDALRRAGNERDPAQVWAIKSRVVNAVRQSVAYHTSRLEGVPVPDDLNRLSVYRNNGADIMDGYFNVTRG